MIAITGDTHGDIRRFDAPLAKKLKSGDTLLVCGDFGFLWEDGEEEQKLLAKLEKKKYTIAFVDGTHENFDLLNRCKEVQWCGGKAHQVASNVYHMMRGEVFTIEGKKVFALGGGENPDKEMYMESGKWWECEMPTISEMRHGVENLNKVGREVDYIITHEPPISIRNMLDKKGNYINALEAFLDELSKEVKYKKWFFGCTHIDRKVSGKYFSVFREVLSAEPIESKRRFR